MGLCEEVKFRALLGTQAALRVAAEKDGTTVSEFVRSAVEKALIDRGVEIVPELHEIPVPRADRSLVAA